MANHFIAFMRCVNLGIALNFKGYSTAAPIFGMPAFRVRMNAPVTGLAQGRIVSISRGSPPPKKR